MSPKKSNKESIERDDDGYNGSCSQGNKTSKTNAKGTDSMMKHPSIKMPECIVEFLPSPPSPRSMFVLHMPHSTPRLYT